MKAGEYYLSDLIGYRVINRDGIGLGTVAGFRFGTGKIGSAAQWLEVTETGNQSQPLLIPLVDQYVEALEPEAKQIKVDWQCDW